MAHDKNDSLGSADPNNHELRLKRLEEAIGFTEHAGAQLGLQVAEMNKRLYDAINRLELLERRINSLAAREGDADGKAPATNTGSSKQ